MIITINLVTIHHHTVISSVIDYISMPYITPRDTFYSLKFVLLNLIHLFHLFYSPTLPQEPSVCSLYIHEFISIMFCVLDSIY